MNRFFTLLLAASCLTAVGQDDSESIVFDGFSLIYLGDSTAFFMSDHQLPWDQAQESCSDLGGHLATFATYEENMAVVEASFEGFWFGLSQSPGASEPDLGWGWVTGEQLNYLAWFTSEPNNATGAEDCAIQTLQDYPAWDDATCSYSYRYVLEVTAVEGCTNPAACNYNFDALLDDGSCDLFTCRCLEGTIWSEELGGCVVANPSDSNFDGCVQLNDLLYLLSAYGDCSAEETPWQCGDPLGYQGYDYETVQIGEQCWFAENLRAENYRNGDSIPSSVSNSVWQETDEGSVSVFGESMDCEEWAPFIDACDPSVSLGTYGRLYNWYAVNDDRGLCASGWHVPSDAEWISLELGLGMLPEESILTDDYRGTDQGIQMKLYDGWDASETAGTNSSNFSSLPGGYRSVSGLFWDAGRNGYFWSATIQGTDQAYFRNLTYNRAGVYRAATNAEYGFSIRCIKDAE